jgi:hypothetical protein
MSIFRRKLSLVDLPNKTFEKSELNDDEMVFTLLLNSSTLEGERAFLLIADRKSDSAINHV